MRWAIEKKEYSQRRACSLVGLAPKVYRHRSRRADDGVLRTRLKELEGAYLYADYVSSKIWALRYDDAKKRVVANQPIRDPKAAVMSFGEDEKGEVYFMTYSATGKGIYWFVKAEAKVKE